MLCNAAVVEEEANQTVAFYLSFMGSNVFVCFFKLSNQMKENAFLPLRL